jgi:hypothetical protein
MARRMFPIIHFSKISVFQHPFSLSVVDPHHLMLIRMRIWIQMITLMPIRIQIFLFDADPDPTFHHDADPDPDPSFKKRLEPLKVLK